MTIRLDCAEHKQACFEAILAYLKKLYWVILYDTDYSAMELVDSNTLCFVDSDYLEMKVIGDQRFFPSERSISRLGVDLWKR